MSETAGIQIRMETINIPGYGIIENIPVMDCRGVASRASSVTKVTGHLEEEGIDNSGY